MSDDVVKTNSTGYVFDKKSGAVLNNNEDEWQTYQAARRRAMQIERMNSEIASLKSRVEFLERLIQEKLK